MARQTARVEAASPPEQCMTVELEPVLERERSERARLQAELDLLRTALDCASTHFAILDVSDPCWKIVYVNRAACEGHGYEPHELIGCSPQELLAAKGSESALERIREGVRQEQRIAVELFAKRKDGSTFWVGVNLMPLPSASAGTHLYLCVGADITARLAQERSQRELQERLYAEMQERERIAIELRLAQKLESVGRLAAGIAHEINTPIQYVGDSVTFLQTAQSDLFRLNEEYRAVIGRLLEGQPPQGVIEALRAREAALDLGFLSTEMPKAFERTLEGVERVAAIVRAMKEFAHPDGAQQQYSDLNHAIQTTLTVAHNEYKYIAQIETHLGEIPEVNCNVGELNQVFLNLIVNAAHAVGESGQDSLTGRITLTTTTDGEEVAISIGDNGCGIPQENVEKVFDPFFTTKPVGLGTGQGLAIARSIVVEKHGGRIDVSSELGVGTTFTLHLPIKGVAREAA
ncbi:MAG TPA: ATP-binding protein [Steroidobacteraceae bacterium]|nr:ATP-binding protein [Steroidobacteraceae bacterium]